MNIPGLKVWRKCFPYFDFRMHFLYLAPCCISHSFTVEFRKCKQEIKLTRITFSVNNHTTGFLLITHDAIGFTLIDTVLDRFSGNYFSIFLELIIPHSEFFK